MSKKILAGILAIIIVLAGVLVYQFYLAPPPTQPEKELKLSDFPEVSKITL